MHQELYDRFVEGFVELTRKYVLGEEVDDWVLVNQAISSEKDETRWRRMLEDAVERSGDT